MRIIKVLPIVLVSLLPMRDALAEPPSLAAAARSFLAALAEDQRDVASWAFDHPEREAIRFAPVRLEGARHGHLEPRAKAEGEDLLARLMSPRGYEKSKAIRLLERDLRVLESGWEQINDFRDPERYHWAFFGEPEADSNWGFRFEGHHLSINVTAAPGRVAATLPLFLGARPRLASRGMPSAGVAALGVEERLVRELYRSLAGDQLEAATLPYKAERGHMLGQVATLADPPPKGLPRSAMTARQQALLDEFLALFTGLWNVEIAAAREAEVAAARDGLHFAFATLDQPPHDPFYVRVSGPGLLIEIDNTEDGDHLHAVWHRPGSDFGRDLMTAHVERHQTGLSGPKLARISHQVACANDECLGNQLLVSESRKSPFDRLTDCAGRALTGLLAPSTSVLPQP